MECRGKVLGIDGRKATFIALAEAQEKAAAPKEGKPPKRPQWRRFAVVTAFLAPPKLSNSRWGAPMPFYGQKGLPVRSNRRDGSWPFSTSSAAPATILGSAGPLCSIYELRQQRDLTNADPWISWSSCTHAAPAAQ